jgi:hypothetical protein
MSITTLKQQVKIKIMKTLVMQSPSISVSYSCLRLRHLVTSLSQWRPGSVHMGFVVDKVALGQVLL